MCRRDVFCGIFFIAAVLNCTIEKHIFQFDSHVKNQMLEDSCILGCDTM